jgi:F0F1-type ATP synthase membrane subunit c/vacuolar-type H+-ATPase subunit K
MYQNRPNTGVNIDAQYRTMLILWFAFLMSVVMYFVISLAAPQPAETGNRMLTILLSALGAFLVGVSFVVKKKFLAQAVETQQTRLVNTALILAAAFCEAAALIGLLDLFIARDRYYVVLIAISFLGLLLHFPRRSHLEAASFKSQSGLS